MGLESTLVGLCACTQSTELSWLRSPLKDVSGLIYATLPLKISNIQMKYLKNDE